MYYIYWSDRVFDLVALDVDGTILDSQHALPGRVEAAIRATRAAGVTVVLATGKLFASIIPLIARLGLHGPQITCNGAAIADAATGAVSAQWPLAGEALHVALRALAQHAPGVPIAWYTQAGILTDAPWSELDVILAAYREPPLVRVPRLDPAVLPPPLKLLLTGTPSALAELRAATEPEVGGMVRIVRTSVDFLEYMSPQASKGVALRAVQARLGIDPARTLAIGDGENDLPLLAAAGTGLAVANAVPELRALAEAIIPANDAAGVAQALADYVLRPRGIEVSDV